MTLCRGREGSSITLADNVSVSDHLPWRIGVNLPPIRRKLVIEMTPPVWVAGIGAEILAATMGPLLLLIVIRLSRRSFGTRFIIPSPELVAQSRSWQSSMQGAGFRA